MRLNDHTKFSRRSLSHVRLPLCASVPAPGRGAVACGWGSRSLGNGYDGLEALAMAEGLYCASRTARAGRLDDLRHAARQEGQ